MRYQLVAGQLPAGVQITSNGLVTGVPQAVSTVQGVPTEVNQDVVSKFVIRAYTYFEDGSVDELADRTFTLTITGNDPPVFLTPAGAFANNNTASFIASFSGTTMTVTSLTAGEISLGMWVRGPGVEPGTTVVAYGTGSGTSGTYTVSIRQTQTSTTCTGVVGVYFDSDRVVLQIEYEDNDPDETTTVRLIGGQLPPGLTLSSSGLISGVIAPATVVDETAGYDLTPSWLYPYDFLVSAISRNYQFTLEVTDGKASDIRTFTIFVYNRDDATADDTFITADGTFVTADVTEERAPFLINADPSDLGTVRSDNNFAYRFRAQDYDGEPFEFTIEVAQGIGLPPGLTLDPYSGWYYGYIPDQGLVQIEYSFNIRVRARSLVIASTESGTNIINTAITSLTTRSDFYVGTSVVFEREVIGGLDADTVYYVVDIIDENSFQVSDSPGGAPVVLTDATASGLAQCVPADIAVSEPYPFTLTVTGVVDSEVSWITDADLGLIKNGETSTLKVEAVNIGGRDLAYRLRSGSFSELPQGLTLLPTGDIAGRVTFNTFGLDLGTTTFDVELGLATGQPPTTFDSTFVFTVNAYAPDTQQTIYRVSEITVLDGGSGYSSAPSIIFNTPVGARAEQATGTVQVSGGSITGVTITEPGDGYTDTATFSLVGAGSGAVLSVVMEATGNRDAISVFKTFTVRINRAYDKPWQNLYVVATPPSNDRTILAELLTNQEIFVPEYIYRASDPYFGLSTQVRYQHAFGLDPDALSTYVESLSLNHYRKNLILGPIKTAQARDSNDNIIYEVVYSEIVDDLVNAEGDSVSKIVTLPYSITDPRDGSTVINSVYPNSLVNMRDQVIDTVGQTSVDLPLWMTSKQANGRVLGFTTAWVICYTNPGRSRQIAYYIQEYFGQQLNVIDFTVDRYILDNELLRNWDTSTQNWTPEPSLTTFDRVNTTGFRELGNMGACTELAFADVNGRTIQDINTLGGLDGATWIAQTGQSPPVGTQIVLREGSLIAFVKQEDYSGYPSTDDAWSRFDQPFDSLGFDSGDIIGEGASFDFGPTVNGGYVTTCNSTDSATDLISSDSTLAMQAGDTVWFTGTVFGGIDDETAQGNTEIYEILEVDSLTVTATTSGLNRLTVSSTAGLALDDEVWFSGTTFGGLADTDAQGLPIPYYIVDIPSATQFTISTEAGGDPVAVSTATGSLTMYLPRFSVTQDGTTAVSLTTASGTMFVNYRNIRMAIWQVSITPGTVPNVDDIISLTPVTQTVTNDYITSSQGRRYDAGTLLYRPGTPQQDLSRVNWQPLITATTVISSETIFDGGSIQFVEPVDMYDPTNRFDKYLVFPKTNILV